MEDSSDDESSMSSTERKIQNLSLTFSNTKGDCYTKFMATQKESRESDQRVGRNAKTNSVPETVDMTLVESSGDESFSDTEPESDGDSFVPGTTKVLRKYGKVDHDSIKKMKTKDAIEQFPPDMLFFAHPSHGGRKKPIFLYVCPCDKCQEGPFSKAKINSFDKTKFPNVKLDEQRRFVSLSHPFPEEARGKLEGLRTHLVKTDQKVFSALKEFVEGKIEPQEFEALLPIPAKKTPNTLSLMNFARKVLDLPIVVKTDGGGGPGETSQGKQELQGLDPRKRRKTSSGFTTAEQGPGPKKRKKTTRLSTKGKDNNPGKLPLRHSTGKRELKACRAAPKKSNDGVARGCDKNASNAAKSGRIDGLRAKAAKSQEKLQTLLSSQRARVSTTNRSNAKTPKSKQENVLEWLEETAPGLDEEDYHKYAHEMVKRGFKTSEVLLSVLKPSTWAKWKDENGMDIVPEAHVEYLNIKMKEAGLPRFENVE